MLFDIGGGGGLSLSKNTFYFDMFEGLSSTHSSGEVEDDQLLVVSAVHPGIYSLAPLS